MDAAGAHSHAPRQSRSRTRHRGPRPFRPAARTHRGKGPRAEPAHGTQPPQAGQGGRGRCRTRRPPYGGPTVRRPSRRHRRRTPNPAGRRRRIRPSPRRPSPICAVTASGRTRCGPRRPRLSWRRGVLSRGRRDDVTDVFARVSAPARGGGESRGPHFGPGYSRSARDTVDWTRMIDARADRSSDSGHSRRTTRFSVT
jgi:hypothetical protein